MATIEERLAAIEREHEEFKRNNEELKQKIELYSIAVGALVNKATLGSINEQNDKIFQTLIAHDEFTNRQLAELREKVEVQVEGEIVGLQTVVRQGFEAVNARFEQQEATMNARFEQQEAAMNARFEQQGKQMEAQGTQIETLNKQMETLGTQMGQVLLLLNTLANKPA